MPICKDLQTQKNKVAEVLVLGRASRLRGVGSPAPIGRRARDCFGICGKRSGAEPIGAGLFGIGLWRRRGLCRFLAGPHACGTWGRLRGWAFCQGLTGWGCTSDYRNFQVFCRHKMPVEEGLHHIVGGDGRRPYVLGRRPGSQNRCGVPCLIERFAQVSLRRAVGSVRLQSFSRKSIE
jgi:hypothetical protein